MKENLTLLVALLGLALPWAHQDDADANRLRRKVRRDLGGMPPDERDEDWS